MYKRQRLMSFVRWLKGRTTDNSRGEMVRPRAKKGDARYREICSHLWSVSDVTPSGDGCEDCLLSGSNWVHLRLCMVCGYVGCCESSPNEHAAAHWQRNPSHSVIRSFEAGENWWWCYVERILFDIQGAPPSPSHR